MKRRARDFRDLWDAIADAADALYKTKAVPKAVPIDKLEDLLDAVGQHAQACSDELTTRLECELTRLECKTRGVVEQPATWEITNRIQLAEAENEKLTERVRTCEATAAELVRCHAELGAAQVQITSLAAKLAKTETELDKFRAIVMPQKDGTSVVDRRTLDVGEDAA